MLIPIIGWIVFGLIVGAIARLLYPGRQDLGFVKTILLGVVGSFVGGFLAFLLFGGSAMQASGWIGSIVGAVLVLAIAARWGSPRAV
ncbi:GlsB/YeaQ/YmgE family stress response membrane protein [Rhodopirellula sp. JC740]|uniref:GlsB/YeaQ/YmgE family stress response membrane protein n=1 Tax=Rhodopirellula halodulae TaxID=2894198 RepID=A0ABS8NEP3_9BACT|nr:GlsB/YeaQ/YmgE family stress response membrane protein [Rhodopirellula sp. JC740]MCC9642020.1 GlsB/YeaQ/YmgE family stress response membrane protein [Rhodopirellula sp. JC740]